MSRPVALNEVLAILRHRRAETASQYKIELVGVVGSVARGEETSASDVDIIVKPCGRPKFSDVLALEDVLGQALGRSVDLVFSEAMKPDRRRHIERDLVFL